MLAKILLATTLLFSFSYTQVSTEGNTPEAADE